MGESVTAAALERYSWDATISMSSSIVGPIVRPPETGVRARLTRYCGSAPSPLMNRGNGARLVHRALAATLWRMLIAAAGGPVGSARS